MDDAKNKMDIDESDEIDLLDLIYPIVKNKNFIIKTTLYAFFLSAVISLLLPKIYKSTAKILPPQNQTSMSQQLLGQLAGFAGMAGSSIPSVKDNGEMYSDFLKSNYVIDYVIDKNDLFKVYKLKTDDRESLRKKVSDSIIIESNKKSGILTIGYLDRDPILSCKIVGSLIDGLKNLNNNLAITEAAQRRLFYEEQLKAAKENLILSEEDFKKFQQKTGIIKVDDEAKSAIEEAALIRARISSKEVELKVLQSYATRESPDYKNLVDEIQALKEQLAKLQSKLPSDDDSLLSTNKVSSYGIEYIRKMREFTYNESLYEILLKQYEAARLDESRDATVIQIIDRPEIPEKKFKPKRKNIVIVSTFTVFFILLFVVFIKEFFNNIKEHNTESYSKIEKMKVFLTINDTISEIKSDVNKFLRFVRIKK